MRPLLHIQTLSLTDSSFPGYKIPLPLFKLTGLTLVLASVLPSLARQRVFKHSGWHRDVLL